MARPDNEISILTWHPCYATDGQAGCNHVNNPGKCGQTRDGKPSGCGIAIDWVKNSIQALGSTGLVEMTVTADGDMLIGRQAGYEWSVINGQTYDHTEKNPRIKRLPPAHSS